MSLQLNNTHLIESTPHGDSKSLKLQGTSWVKRFGWITYLEEYPNVSPCKLYPDWPKVNKQLEILKIDQFKLILNAFTLAKT